MAAIVGATLLAVGPALVAGIASAAPSEPQVEFSGGSVLNMSMVACKSEPSTSTLTVQAETSVRFANRLGQTASLKINGNTVSQVAPNLAVPVLFHSGPVTVTMSIPCKVGVVAKFGSVVVNVIRPATASSTSADGPRSTTQSGATQANGHASAAMGRAAPGAAGRPDESKSPNAAGSPAAGDAAVWGPGMLDQSQSPLAKDLSAGTNPSLADGAAPADVGAVVPASGMPRRTPSGLLTLIATVLTIGVGVAAVRSLMAVRATSARFA